MLPKLVDPRRLAEQRAVYSEEMAVSDLPRVADFVESGAKKVQIDLSFDRDEQYRIRVTGSIQGSVNLVCQRCMDLVETRFQQDMDLMVVRNDEQSKSVPRDIDPWEVGETANLHELVEDEIFLALPVVARHEVGECEAPPIPDSGVVVEQEEDRQPPFEILKDLTKSSDEN